MKLNSILLSSLTLLVPIAAASQKPAPAKPHVAAHVATHTAATTGCAKLPPLSPRIPALPPGTPCAKALFTLTTTPPARTSDASPAVTANVDEYLGIAPVTFSLAYIDTKVGTGAPAEPHKFYSVLYTGYLHDGTVFDSSAKHPEMGAFVLQQGAHQVIPGWDTGFYGMHVGGKRRLFIPFQLAYGNRASGAIPPGSDLIFDIELVSQSDKDPRPAPAAPPAPAASPTPAPQPAPAPSTSQPAAPATSPAKPQ